MAKMGGLAKTKAEPTKDDDDNCCETKVVLGRIDEGVEQKR